MNELNRPTFPLIAFTALLAAACGSQNSAAPKNSALAQSAAKASLGFSPQFGARSPADAGSATGSASFDAPVVDTSTWAGTPAGTGTYAVSLASGSLSGGPQSAAASGTDSAGTLWHEVIVADFSVASGGALAVAIDDATFASGTLTIDGVHVMASVFDISTGNELAQATGGTVTLSAAGSAVGSEVTGSLAGSFVSSATTSSTCSTDTDCPRGDVCTAGTCTVPSQPSGCSTDSDCPSGETCQSGVCTAPTQGTACANGQGTGAFTVQIAASDVCSALTATLVNVPNAQAQTGAIDASGSPTIVLVDPSSPNGNMLALELTACPSAAGTLSIGSGVEAYAYVDFPNAGTHLSLYAVYQATSGSVIFTAVGATLAGSATLGFDNGGSATANFDLQ